VLCPGDLGEFSEFIAAVEAHTGGGMASVVLFHRSAGTPHRVDKKQFTFDKMAHAYMMRCISTNGIHTTFSRSVVRTVAQVEGVKLYFGRARCGLV
jgi:hypothetical protein